MAFDITVRHPEYLAFEASWQLMRDAMDGEDAIKAGGKAKNPFKYLPMKSGILAMSDETKRQAAYDAYRLRAEFPEIVAPTIRGATGIMLAKATTIELPKALEPLKEKATRDGLTLDSLHRRIALELMTVGRYGLLPGIAANGDPYLAGYVTESIINWDATDQEVDFVVLDESGYVRDPSTNEWGASEAYLECSIENGAYVAKRWVKTSAGWQSEAEVVAQDRKRRAISSLPFVFIGANDLSATPDDVPLYGLAKLAVRVYRLDADYTFAMHMTSEPTPVAIGFDDPAQAVKDGIAPSTIGASKLWILPKGGDAKYLEFSGLGIAAQKEAIADALTRAVAFGAQILTDTSKTAESGEAKKLRLSNEAATIKTIAQNAAAGLEKALKNIAVWVGANPDEVKVEPDTDFFDHELTAQEITAIVKGWQDGAYSWRTTFNRLQKGGVIPTDRKPEDEQQFIAEDQEGRDPAPDELFDPVTGKPLDPTTLPPQLTKPAAA